MRERELATLEALIAKVARAKETDQEEAVRFIYTTTIFALTHNGRGPKWKSPARRDGKTRCSECREWKQPEEMVRNVHKPNGLATICKPCKKLKYPSSHEYKLIREGRLNREEVRND